MQTIYSSETLTGDRRRGWQQLIGEIYANLDIEIPAGGEFFGRICRSNLGEIEFTDVVTDGESARRTPRHIALDRRESYLYLFVRAGELNLVQFNRDCTVRAGQFTLVHLNSPYLFRHDKRVSKLGVKIPGPMLRSRVTRPELHCAVARVAQAGIARLAANYLDTLSDEAPGIADALAQGLTAMTTDLVGLLLDSADWEGLPDDSIVRGALRRRSMAYIDAHCGDPDLDPAAIAAAMGISVRYLHRCFEPCESTVAEYLRLRRLRKCRADLLDPIRSRRPISEIARRNGFHNVCHFNEAFKAEYGVSPRQVRDGRRPEPAS